MDIQILAVPKAFREESIRRHKTTHFIFLDCNFSEDRFARNNLSEVKSVPPLWEKRVSINDLCLLNFLFSISINRLETSSLEELDCRDRKITGWVSSCLGVVVSKSKFFEIDFALKSHLVKVARNEVKNASFAQCSAHRDSRIWQPELIEPAAERKRRARADDDGCSNRPTPTHRFCHSAIFHPISLYNVWFFWVSRHRSIILAKKMETFSGRSWEIPGNVRKLELSKALVDHKNALVFYQAVSGKSSWSFSYRWTQYQ